MRKLKPKSKKCPVCGTKFIPSKYVRDTKVYCSGKCYHKSFEEDYRKERRAQTKRWYYSKAGRIYYKKTRKLRSEQNNKRKRKLKQIIIEYYGGKCACCGENRLEFLTIDHINGGGAKHRKKIGVTTGGAFYCWLRQRSFPKGYRVLCFNCNCSIGAFGYCPHKSLKRGEGR